MTNANQAFGSNKFDSEANMATVQLPGAKEGLNHPEHEVQIGALALFRPTKKKNL